MMLGWLLARAGVTVVVLEKHRDFLRDLRGVVATTPDGTIAIDADLVVGADGRHSDVRAKAGLVVENFGAPIDVLWMRISRKAADPEGLIGNLDAGIVFVMIDRDDYWQCALVIPKGGIDDIHARGLPAFRHRIRSLVPFLGDRVEELHDWNAIKLLTVVVDRLRTWHKP